MGDLNKTINGLTFGAAMLATLARQGSAKADEMVPSPESGGPGPAASGPLHSTGVDEAPCPTSMYAIVKESPVYLRDCRDASCVPVAEFRKGVKICLLRNVVGENWVSAQTLTAEPVTGWTLRDFLKPARESPHLSGFPLPGHDEPPAVSGTGAPPPDAANVFPPPPPKAQQPAPSEPYSKPGQPKVLHPAL